MLNYTPITLTGVIINTNLVWTSHNTGVLNLTQEFLQCGTEKFLSRKTTPVNSEQANFTISAESDKTWWLWLIYRAKLNLSG